MTPPHPDLLDALRLRRWALDALTTGARPAPEASPAAWELFLLREACAASLRVRLGSAAPPPVRAAADCELQQVLLLRAELDAVLEVAREIGVAPILLKGAATLHLPAKALWAKDLDLLLPSPDAVALVRALDERGWHQAGAGTAGHFGERVRPGRPPVEVHPADAALALMATRAVPHPARTGARLLHPDDHTRHVATHQAITHPSHRGRVRDLLLLATALESAAPRQDDPREDQSSERPTPVHLVLRMAGAIREARHAEDPFRLEAAIWYALDRRAGSRPVSKLRRVSATWIFALSAGGGAVEDLWARSWDTRLETSGLGGRLRAALRHAARLLWLPPLIGWSWVAALRQRRAAARLLATLDEPAERR